MDGPQIAALRSGGQHVSLAGLHDVAKALVAAYIAHELRRPAFFVTDSNRRAEALADTLRFFSTIFPCALGGVGPCCVRYVALAIAKPPRRHS